MQFYYGWVIVAISAIGSMLVNGATMASFGLFVIPVSEDLGMSRADVNTAFIIVSTGNAVLAPFVGRYADKYSSRLIVLISAISLAAGYTVLGMVSHLWLMVFALFVLIPIGLDGGALITLNMLVVRWFKKQRTRALAIAAIGLSLSAGVVTPAIAVMIEHFDWRMTLVILGIACAIILAISAYFIREWPGPDDHEPSPKHVDSNSAQAVDQGSPGEPMPIRAILKSLTFWIIATPPSFLFAITTTLMVSLVPIAVGRGLTSLEGAGLMSILAVAGVLAKIVLAYYGDRVNNLLVFLVLIGGVIVLNLALLHAYSYELLVASSVLFGLTWGAAPPVYFSLVADRFGPSSYGTIRGLINPISMVLHAMCLRFAGEVFDRTGNYDVMFWTFMAVLLAALAMVSSLHWVKDTGTKSSET